MQVVDKKSLEKEIISLTEEVIESTILACQEEWEPESEQNSLVSIISSLAGKIALYLDGQDAYLKEVIQQLIQQKLPDERILKNLPDFSQKLDQVIENGIAEYNMLCQQEKIKVELENSQPNVNDAKKIEAEEIVEVEEDSIAQLDIETVEQAEVTDLSESTFISSNEEQKKALLNNQSNDEVELFLHKYYPHLTLIKNYSFHGTKLQYYIPELKLALEKKENSNNLHASRVWKEYHCVKAGIKLLYLSKNELLNYRTLNKFIKKYAIN